MTTCKPDSPIGPPAENLREALLAFCEGQVDLVWKKDWGYQRPDPGKLLREGLRQAQRAIEAVPAQGAPEDYLARVQEGLDALLDGYRGVPLSQDGWRDEDGYLTSGINTIRNQVAWLRRVP